MTSSSPSSPLPSAALMPVAPVPGVVAPRARTVYLVTHPEASHHVDRLVGGQYDSELTAAGAEDAIRIGVALAASIDEASRARIVSSDLARTRRTAEAIGEALGVEPILDARLREKSYGEAEGRPQEWLNARFVPLPAVGDRLRHGEGLAGAETRLELAARVYLAMLDALDRAGDPLIVVTHGFAATFVVASWIGMPLDAAGHVSVPVAPGSITVLREDEHFHNRAIVVVGDTSHLVRGF